MRIPRCGKMRKMAEYTCYRIRSLGEWSFCFEEVVVITQFIYKEISRIEAMAKIDSGEVSDLYFVHFYYESDEPYSHYENHVQYLINCRLMNTEPILYHSEYIIKTNRLFGKYKKVLAEPNNTFLPSACRKHKKHVWLIKQVQDFPKTTDWRKPPFLKGDN